MCEFSYRLDDEVQLMCKLTTKPCIYRKYCKKTGTFIHLDDWSECFLRNDELERDIPSGSYFVRFEKKGYLYVEINDKIVKIKNTLNGGKVDNYIYLKEVGNGEYSISLNPIVDEPKEENNVEIVQELTQEIEVPKKPKKRKSTNKKKNESN